MRAIMRPAAATDRLADLALLGLLATLWGASYSFIKIGVETIPPISLIAARTVVAGALLLLVLRLRGLALPREPAVWRGFLVQALLNSAVPFTLIAWAERTVDAGVATILNSTSPVFTFLLTALLAGGAGLSTAKLIGVAAGFGGVALIVGPSAVSGLGRELAAELAIVAATLCYAGAALWGRRFRGLDPLLPAAGSLICGAVMLVPLALAVDRPWTLDPSARSLGALAALAVFSTALAFVVYFRLLRTLGPVGTTAQAYLRVPVGVAAGMVLLGEQPSPTVWIGLACVVAGVAAMTLEGPGSTPRPSSWWAQLGALAARRRQRLALAELDDARLRDLGLTREQVERETRKPFWR